MQVIDLIHKKRDKSALSKEEINYLIKKYIDGSIKDYQMSPLLMAICINGMTDEEISHLTDSMLHSGQIIAHEEGDGLIIDKHSTGGVGDKISIPLAPAVAACGLRVPMIAGRGLGHTGGTLDKLEAIPGFKTTLNISEYREQIAKIGCCIIGQTEEIVPADKLLYALRDVSGTVESIPLIASSIMSKKLAEGIDGLVLDVKFGSGAFIKEFHKARLLAMTMVNIGASMGKKVTACMTNMDQPLGCLIGNVLEILESIEILKGEGPTDTKELTIELGAEMLLLGHKAKDLKEGREKIKEAISSGRAWNKFLALVSAQGGDIKYLLNPKKFDLAPQKIKITATSSGFVTAIDNHALGESIRALGGRRQELTDTIDPRVGIEIHVKIGDHILIDQPLATIHADQRGIFEAKSKIIKAIAIGDTAVIKPELFADRISTN